MVKCHLPNQNEAIFYIWKSIDGLKDVVVFYSGRVSERIEITAHAKDVLQANCIRCHAQMVWHINQERRITHRFNGMRETI